MEMHQLKYAIAVADTGNFTRAAERVFVSQPSLSQQVINLETELGHKLFHRLGRKAVPTAAGVAFLERARKILLDVENATREMHDDPAFARKVGIGAIPTIAPYLFPPLLQRCLREHPNLVVHTREDFRGPLCRAVSDGELDLAIVSQPVTEPELTVEVLFSEKLLLAIGREHRLARKKEITPQDLKEETFILLGDSSSLTSQIQRFCGDHHFQPKIGFRCTQVRTVKALAALGVGISILPQVTRSAEDRELIYRDLSGGTPVREIAIVRNEQRYQSRGLEAFINVLRLAIRSYHWGTPAAKVPASAEKPVPGKLPPPSPRADELLPASE